jgi:hypothetical protein
MTFRDQLVKIDACPDSLKWVKNKTIEEAWKTCKNPEWMLWILAKTGLDLIDPLCDMAERVLHLVPEDRQLACIWAISAARRRANEDELNAAAYAAETAAETATDATAHAEGEAATEDADCAAYSASDAAAYAKYCATDATCSASDNVAYYASRAVAVAACYAYRTAHCANNTDSYAVAVSVAAADSAFRTAYNREQKKQCDIIRKYFTITQVKKVFKKLVA